MRALSMICAAFLLLVASCGGDPDACSSDPDCTTGEVCMWILKSGAFDGRRCTTRCSSDSECAGGGSCSLQAVTCPTCKDLSRVCAN